MSGRTVKGAGVIAALVGGLIVIAGASRVCVAAEVTPREESQATETEASENTTQAPDDAPGDEPITTIVVTSTRTETPLEETTTSISVIDETEIREQQAETVLEVLRNEPGVDILQNGSRGTASDIFIRGAESDQTLVLIDGVEVNSVTIGAFDFANLTTDNVERIEILRGSGGTLYGSQAIGGVVNVVTRQGRGAPTVELLGEGGNGSTARGRVSSSGQFGRLHYSVAGAYLDTQGFQPENDDYRNATASLRLDYDVTANAAARFFFRYTDTDLGLVNNNNFLNVRDPNARITDEFMLIKGEWEQEIVPDLELRLAASYTRDDQEFEDPPDAAETSLTISDIPSRIVTGEIQANHYWREIATTTVGIEIEGRSADVRSDVIDPAFESLGRFEESRGNVAGYFQEQLRFLDGRIIAVGGVRVDGNDDFGTEVSPAGSVSLRVPGVPGLRVKGGYAEGFRAPTFNELFFPDFGNPDLDAETSREYNAGIVQTAWEGRAVLDVTFFDRKTENLIEGTVQDDGRFLAVNRGDAHVRGVEIAPRVILSREPELSVRASYTRLETVSDERLLRRPKDRGAVIVNLAGRDLFRPATRYNFNVNLHVVGDRIDVNPAHGFAFDDNPAYTKLDVAGSYTFERVIAGRGDFGVFAKIENVLDDHYEEALGFEAPPINFLAGVRATF